MSMKVSRGFVNAPVALRCLVAAIFMCPVVTFAGAADDAVAVVVDRKSVV